MQHNYTLILKNSQHSGTMHIHMAPAYASLRPEIETLEKAFEQGRILQEGRNSVRVCLVGGQEVNVKCYKQPAFWQRIVYRLLRKPKGLRSFLYPTRLKWAKINSPQPIAYREDRQGGLITTSWLVTEQCLYRRNFREMGAAELTDEVKDILRAFVRFTARMHGAGFLHLDYSPGNILFDREEGKWAFSVVDTNRMRFGSVSVRRGCENFARLWGQPDMFRFIAEEYAAVRHANSERCIGWTMEARKRFWTRFNRRHQVKGFTLNF